MSATLNDWVDNKVVAIEDNPVLQGNFAPVNTECELTELEVVGELPAELNGMLLRDGPNPINPGKQYHWFSGEGMLHAIRLENGVASSYRNRFIRTTKVEQELGHSAVAGLEPELLIQGSGGVNVIQHAGKVLALGELGYPYEVSTNADTVGMYNFAGKLAGNMTAHPKIDGVTGEMLFFGYDVLPPFLRYHRVSASGELISSVDIDLPKSVMMHDFGVTASRVVFMDLPVIANLELVSDGVELPFEWDLNHQARLGVLDRTATTDDVKWIDIDPCYVFHPLNSYDDGDKVIMDVVRYERMFTNTTTGNYERGSALVRWTIDVAAGRVETRVLSAIDQEFPRINPRHECHPHRFGYSIEAGGQHGFKGLLKHDLVEGTTTSHWSGANYAAGEPVFVPLSDVEGDVESATEDQGYILSVMYNASTQLSELHVLDAQQFTSPPVAVVKLGARVPFGFHGNFVEVAN